MIKKSVSAYYLYNWSLKASHFGRNTYI